MVDVITLELAELLWLGIAQLGAFLALTAIAIWLVIRAFRGLIKIQELHISALASRLETEVGEMRRMVETLRERIGYLEEYIAGNGLTVPHSREQAQELIKKRVEEQATARALMVDTTAELRNESARLRQRPSQQLIDEVKEEARGNKRTI